MFLKIRELAFSFGNKELLNGLNLELKKRKQNCHSWRKWKWQKHFFGYFNWSKRAK